MRRGVAGLAAGLGALMWGAGVPAAADTPVWRGPPFFFHSVGTPLAEVLRDFGGHYGMPTLVSAQVNDTFIGTLQDIPPQRLLDELAQRYRLSWYHDGQTLHVYKSLETSRRLLTLRYVKLPVVAEHLRAAGVLHPKHCLAREITAANAVEVAGVPACLETVSALAQHLEDSARQTQESEESIEILPLRYASADDTRYQYRNQQVVVPGIASVLRDLVLGARPLAQDAEAAPSPATPRFSADSRRNAVIVRDRRRNLPIYADLVRQLDIKPRLIDISVSIIDVNANDMDALGIDFSGATRLGGAGSVEFNTGLTESSNFSTVVGDTGKFLIRLNALEKNSKARVLSRPSVVTLDNMQAVLDRNITFYTKLYGNKSGNLESASTGLLLRVTPRLVDEAGAQEIMLFLNLEDGHLTPDKTNVRKDIPNISSSSISTHATLRAGQSLLLGGFLQDEQHESEQKIPLLGDIPILGRLFSSTQNRTTSVIRLFLIKAEPAPLS
ncbi:EscC/YscC/HrcC family type III secretion system outer membrane ring protein [Pandoraea terrae]|uniref:Type 3 secretion system secretin n=1 Tax=Pandoraea terrae TaxID=1537710 RepID=A0A5E4ZFU3_9BURK|nr:EscC/YscC/HrcC family type III secretion system outer membrane ring protein [Pandoraea terrae]VVE59170.1 EscC/YscC/HrcC family type III secretion system outer membrane ring protein [Pandoraea terrae]